MDSLKSKTGQSKTRVFVFKTDPKLWTAIYHDRIEYSHCTGFELNECSTLADAYAKDKVFRELTKDEVDNWKIQNL